jgi:hypothetical protein
MAKDGHGSDERGAHAAGVEEVGKPQTYQWTKTSGKHYLIPEADAGKGNVANAIARVEKQFTADGPANPPYRATVLQGFNTGNARAGNWAQHASVQGAKNWIGRTVANSWSAPTIKK